MSLASYMALTGGLAPKPDGPISALVVYEDTLTARLARLLFDDVAARESPGRNFRGRFWSFDALADRDLLARAARFAQAAELVVISAYDNAHLPTVVEAWLKGWTSDGTVQDGLVVALLVRPQMPAPAATRLHARLERLARLSGREFLAENIELEAVPTDLLRETRGLQKSAIAEDLTQFLTQQPS